MNLENNNRHQATVSGKDSCDFRNDAAETVGKRIYDYVMKLCCHENSGAKEHEVQSGR